MPVPQRRSRGSGRPVMALCTMCIGVGQGIAVVLERVWARGDRRLGTRHGRRIPGPGTVGRRLTVAGD